MKFVSFLLLLSILAFSTCRDEDELPAITMEGKNTFGCLVNGKLWLREGRFGQSGTHADLQLASDTIGINLYASNANSSFIISIYDVPSLQTNKPYDLATGKYYTSYVSWLSGTCDYDSIKSGSVTLSKFDRTNNIISGIFEFTAYSPDCKETISVTDGRFDIAEIFY